MDKLFSDSDLRKWSVAERAKYVEDQLEGMAFVYKDAANKVRNNCIYFFGGVLTVNEAWRLSIGTCSLCIGPPRSHHRRRRRGRSEEEACSRARPIHCFCTCCYYPLTNTNSFPIQVERALTMYKTGTRVKERVVRKGKKSAHSFVAVPWAERARAYLQIIKNLSKSKWDEVLSGAAGFNDAGGQITWNDPVEESSEGPDPRLEIQLSSDDEEDGPGAQVSSFFGGGSSSISNHFSCRLRD